MYIGNDDRIVGMLLMSSNEADFTYQRPDSTTYVVQQRKDKEDVFYTPETQLELDIDLPKPPKPSISRQNILDKFYGKDWKPVLNKDLADHF